MSHFVREPIKTRDTNRTTRPGLIDRGHYRRNSEQMAEANAEIAAKAQKKAAAQAKAKARATQFEEESRARTQRQLEGLEHHPNDISIRKDNSKGELLVLEFLVELT